MNTITDKIKKIRIFVQDHIRGTVPGDIAVSFFKGLAVNDILTKIVYNQEQKNPTKAMLYADQYFTAHQNDVEQIANLLADDFSREVYLAAIKYRKTHNPKDAPKYSKHDQYFVKDIVPLTEEEVFVDCGAYDGNTALQFVSWCGEKQYNKIWCLEPDNITMNKLKNTLSGVRGCSILPYGASDEEKEVSFITTGGEGSKIGGTSNVPGANTIKTMALDDLLQGEKVTFIKMDIEGEEYNALVGAKEIIATQKPRLAISVYHRADDIIKIPALLLELVPEYKFCIRHYSILSNETILYAF